MTRTQKLVIGAMSILVFCVLCLLFGVLLNRVSPTPPSPNPTTQAAAVPTRALTNTAPPPTALPTRIPPSATPQASPTVAPTPTNAASSNTGLNISRDFLVKNFQDLGFDFKQGQPVEGEESHLGMQPNGTTLLSLIGPAGNLKRVSMTVFVSQANDDANTRAALHMLLLTRAIHPDWQGSDTWLTESIQKAASGESVSITRNNILTKLELAQSLGAVMLTFEPAPAP